MAVQITQRDIDVGLRASPSRCPLALAVRRQVRAPVVYVAGRELCVLPRRGEWLTWPLPPSLREWVARYDAGRSVAPIVVQLPSSFRGMVSQATTQEDKR